MGEGGVVGVDLGSEAVAGGLELGLGEDDLVLEDVSAERDQDFGRTCSGEGRLAEACLRLEASKALVDRQGGALGQSCLLVHSNAGQQRCGARADDA